MKITILGDGIWGSALGRLLKENDHQVYFWNKKEQIEPMDAVLIAIPAQAIRQVFTAYGQKLNKAVLINSAKGIEKKSHQLPFQIIRELLGDKVDYFALIGPSFAGEINHKMPTLVNLGGFNGKMQEICDLFETDYFRVKPTKSVKALELAGALKNVYAIASGIADGLGFEANTRAKLISIAYEEFRDLALKLNYPIDNNAWSGTLGDLLLTCSSEESRNYSFGKNLTRLHVAESVKKINSTIEGYATVFSIGYFSKKSPLPLGEFVLKAIEDDNPPTIRNKFAEFVKTI